MIRETPLKKDLIFEMLHHCCAIYHVMQYDCSIIHINKLMNISLKLNVNHQNTKECY